jgi:hypothetical protein
MRFIKLSTLIILIGIGSCNKEKRNKLPGEYYGNAIATKNNAEWASGFVRCKIDINCNNGKLGIEFLKFNERGFLRETFFLLNILQKVGSYKIYPSINYNSDRCVDSLIRGLYATSVDDGDVAGDDYNVLPADNNNITITDYNTSTKEIKGTFEVSFIITRKFNPLAPDTLRFKNGVFYTKILN